METIKDWWRYRVDARHKERAAHFAREVRESFVEHPKETGENFGRHLLFTTRTGLDLILCGVILLIHGLLPFTFRHTVSDRIEKIYQLLKTRAARVAEHHRASGQDI